MRKRTKLVTSAFQSTWRFHGDKLLVAISSPRHGTFFAVPKCFLKKENSFKYNAIQIQILKLLFFIWKIYLVGKKGFLKPNRPCGNQINRPIPLPSRIYWVFDPPLLQTLWWIFTFYIVLQCTSSKNLEKLKFLEQTLLGVWMGKFRLLEHAISQ